MNTHPYRKTQGRKEISISSIPIKSKIFHPLGKIRSKAILKKIIRKIYTIQKEILLPLLIYPSKSFNLQPYPKES
jgi:hypothetical protein